MLPVIRRHAQISFRDTRSELRAELIAEAIAAALATFASLVAHKKEDVAYPSSLARYAVAQVRSGRRVGGRVNSREVMSPQVQKRKGFTVERLDSFDEQEDCWREVFLEDKRATPAEIAACRLDFAAWLALLPRRRRELALTLASGETTSSAARKFRVTAGRISQLRNWFRMSWASFQGDSYVDSPPQLAIA
jgi:hypothetical protein